MKKVYFIIAALATALMAFCPQAESVELDSEKKMELESKLVGDWQVPKNKYKTAIAFSLAQDRTFQCTYQEIKKEAVEYAGHWRVRTNSKGEVKAYLKARNQSDPKSFMKAVLRTDAEMENFMIDITFDFKNPGSWNWHSKFVAAGEGGDDEDSDDEDFDDDEDFEDDDEDFEDDDE